MNPVVSTEQLMEHIQSLYKVLQSQNTFSRSAKLENYIRELEEIVLSRAHTYEVDDETSPNK